MNQSMINSLDDIVDVEDRELVSLHVDAWKKTVMIRPLSSEAADEIAVLFSAASEDKSALVGMRTKLASVSLVSATGERLIKSDDDAKKLGEKSSAALKQIFEFCMELNGFNAKVEDEEKN